MLAKPALLISFIKVLVCTGEYIETAIVDDAQLQQLQMFVRQIIKIPVSASTGRPWKGEAQCDLVVNEAAFFGIAVSITTYNGHCACTSRCSDTPPLYRSVLAVPIVV